MPTAGSAISPSTAWRKYGQTKMIGADLDGRYDEASREAFGLPFATVYEACAAWIRRKA